MSSEQDTIAGEGTPVPSPGSYGTALPFGFHYLTGVMNAVGTFWIFVIMLLMTADVIGRSFFNRPISGVIEIVTLSIVSIVFIQLADTLHKGRFTRADALLGAIGRASPRAGAFLHMMFHLAGAGLVGVMGYASWPLLVESWQTGEYLGAIGTFRAPVWPMRAVILLGTTCTSITFLLLAYANLRTVVRGEARA